MDSQKKDTPKVVFHKAGAIEYGQEEISSVLVVPFAADGKVVAVRNKRGWDLTGGHVEPYDKDIEAAARREAREEANITLGELHPIGTIEFLESREGIKKYMPVMATTVKHMGSFTANDEILERTSMSTDEYLQRQQAGDPDIMKEILNTAKEQMASLQKKSSPRINEGSRGGFIRS